MARRLREVAGLGALVVTLVGAAPSQAGTAQGTLNVAAAVLNTCTVANTSLNFGTVNPATGSALSASANILVQCSMGTNYTVALDNGQNSSGVQRRMKGGVSGGYLNYALYSDATGTTPFGSSPGQTVAAVGLGVSANPIPVYGSIPSGQSSGADTYGDTVAITVSY